MDSAIIYKDESFAIQGAIFEVYRETGSGFLEAVYQECLCRELAQRHIPFAAQVGLALAYKGVPLKQTYCADFVCYDKIIIELKAVSDLRPEHRAQVHNYLKATQMRLGLLVNFCHYPLAQIERIVL
jgi:GxxExxY protein